MVAYDDQSFDVDHISKCQTESFSFLPLTPMEKYVYLDNSDRYHRIVVHLQTKHKDYPISF